MGGHGVWWPLWTSKTSLEKIRFDAFPLLYRILLIFLAFSDLDGFIKFRLD